MDSPIAYLIRAGSTDTSYPLLSDPSLSKAGHDQVEAAREFFHPCGIGPIKAIMTASSIEFAELLASGLTQLRDLPPVYICDSPEARIVYPGGIVAIYADAEGYRYVPKLGEIPKEDLD